VDDAIHSRAHQSKHSTTCCVVSPAMPENKAPLLLPSSAFPGSLVDPPFVWISPGGPSPCLSHYRKAFGYYAASFRSPARWHFRGSCEHRWCERSLISSREVIATLSMLALRRADNEVVLIGLRTQWASRRAILARRYQPFPPSVVTTLTLVPSRGSAPFVSIGRRGSPDGPFGRAHRIHCQRASHPQSCHDWTQAAHPSYHYSSTALQATPR
jgi:hypothetical protein